MRSDFVTSTASLLSRRARIRASDARGGRA
ncbi:hypothetical protein J2Y48_000313 [Mycoplana sp. BE70]|nr:hypothetical protein [Mycoplana sp. BE70]